MFSLGSGTLEFSLFRNTQLEELSSRTLVHVGTLDSAQLLP